ncbi:MAG TPA: GNAT family protein [Candidatus Kapabacteria bacterium]|nr:GNAT family protein [Candidatus Kapabacteria bacterium]
MTFSFEQDLVLENDRALLRPLAMNDANELIKVCEGDEKILQYSPSRVHTPEYLAEYIRIALKMRAQRSRYALAIFDKQAQTWVGSTSFYMVSEPNSRLEIGWTWLGKDHPGTGINRHTKYLMLQHAFDTLGCERVEFMTDERNAQSRRAMEKIGCKLEGILRSHTLLNDGFRRNSAIYSILKQEWESMRDTFLDGHR